MKRWFIGLSALALMGTVPLVGGEPVRAQISDVKDAIVQAILRPEVKLTMGAEKQLITVDNKGGEVISWEALAGNVTVQPGDVLRYTVDGANSGDVEATNLQITQPVPERTTYILGSAESVTAAEITYSIDSGATFVAEPMVEVTLPDGTVEQRPAPAEAYTHVSWRFSDPLVSAETVKVSYNVGIQ
ncbi:MAG: hypothetical protein AAFZ80_02945 [Cyanobacteria bacterium P01_A01_bin.105]